MSVPCSRDPFRTKPLTWQGERDVIGPVRGLDAQCAQTIRRILPLVLLALWSLDGLAAEVIPPKPAAYFNDYAGVVSTSTAHRLNQTLEDFEKSTSSQVVVAVFRKMQSDSSVEDYTRRVAEAWRVGQKQSNNGAVLFVFVQDHRMRIEVGYGLEGALPDALAKRIIEDEIAPRFKSGDYDGGLSAGVTAILQATRGEYKATRRIVPGVFVLVLFFVVLLIMISAFIRFVRRAAGTVYHRRGRGNYGGWQWGGAWGGGGGGGWSGGGGFSGGSFSGGGGSFGGGGASGSW
jgi:uncharacterized protein